MGQVQIYAAVEHATNGAQIPPPGGYRAAVEQSGHAVRGKGTRGRIIFPIATLGNEAMSIRTPYAVVLRYSVLLRSLRATAKYRECTT